MDEICGDWAAEASELDGLLAGVSDDDFERATPAPGWSVRDQISHLWYFDEQARVALTDPDGFKAAVDVLMEQLRVSGTDFSVEPGRSMSVSALMEAWRTGRGELFEVARSYDPSARVPWYGPAMSARSFITARLMEVWAHGQDIVDALGLSRQPTDRLRHVAHIGVRARPYSYVVNGQEPPETDIRVELRAPGGDEWTWGPAGADDVVRGDALDFCLVVTQRRHPADVDLDVTGDVAAGWIAIAQAFAGPVGPGRTPGQFPSTR